MIFVPPPSQFSGKLVVVDPKAELIDNGKVVPLANDAWTFVSKPLTLLDKLNEYYKNELLR